MAAHARRRMSMRTWTGTTLGLVWCQRITCTKWSARKTGHLNKDKLDLMGTLSLALRQESWTMGRWVFDLISASELWYFSQAHNSCNVCRIISKERTKNNVPSLKSSKQDRARNEISQDEVASVNRVEGKSTLKNNVTETWLKMIPCIWKFISKSNSLKNKSRGSLKDWKHIGKKTVAFCSFVPIRMRSAWRLALTGCVCPRLLLNSSWTL